MLGDRAPKAARALFARLTAERPSRRPADVAELLDALGRPAPIVRASGRTLERYGLLR